MNDDSECFNSYIESENGCEISFETKNIKVRFYEEENDTLRYQNKTLREQLSISEDARQNLVKRIEDLTVEFKQMLEFNETTYNAKLQSYCACILRLEEENQKLQLDAQRFENLANYEIERNEQDALNDVNVNTDDLNSPIIDIELNGSTRAVSPSMVTQKDGEIKELKNIVEQLNSEIEMFRSMKTFMEENKEKRKSTLRKSIGAKSVINEQIVNELQENVHNLEIEKSSLENKLKSIEASLTRWIFRACDYKTDLDQTKIDLNELKEANACLNNQLNELNGKMAEFRQSENFKIECEHLKSTNAWLKSEIDRLNESFQKLNDKNVELTNDLKKAETDRNEVVGKMRKDLDHANSQIKSFKDTIKVKEIQIRKIEDEKEDLRTLNVDLKHKELELKAQQDQLKCDVNELTDMKKQIEQFKSEITYLLKKNDNLLNENQQLKKKFDSNLLEKNSIKHQLDEVLVDYKKLNDKCEISQRNVREKRDLCIQTDNFNYDEIIRPLCQKFDKQINEYKHHEQELKQTLDEYKSKIRKIESKYEELNKKFDEEYQINCEMSDRNEFLFSKCEKLKADLNSQIENANRYKSSIDIEKEILETTINQQKKFIDFITNAEPELYKKLEKFMKK